VHSAVNPATTQFSCYESIGALIAGIHLLQHSDEIDEVIYNRPQNCRKLCYHRGTVRQCDMQCQLKLSAVVPC